VLLVGNGSGILPTNNVVGGLTGSDRTQNLFCGGSVHRSNRLPSASCGDSSTRLFVLGVSYHLDYPREAPEEATRPHRAHVRSGWWRGSCSPSPSLPEATGRQANRACLMRESSVRSTNHPNLLPGEEGEPELCFSAQVPKVFISCCQSFLKLW